MLCAGALIAALVVQRGDGLDRVVKAAGLDGCKHIVHRRPADDPDARRWERAEKTGSAACEKAGGHLAWARFPSRTALERDLREHPAGRRVCVYGREVAVDRLLAPPGTDAL